MKKQVIKGVAFAVVLAIVLAIVGVIYFSVNKTDENLEDNAKIRNELAESNVETDIHPEIEKSFKTKISPIKKLNGKQNRYSTQSFSKAKSAEVPTIFGGLIAADENDSNKEGCYIAQHENIPPKPRHFVESFDEIGASNVKKVSKEPISGFSIDVDTSSYGYLRRNLNDGELPEAKDVRIEEMINYFNYDYPFPENAEIPFQPSVAIYPTPWDINTKLLHIGIKGYDKRHDKKPPSNVVFLLDVSGSMNNQEKLPLLLNALKMMIKNLDDEDRISIITYAGRSATILKPTTIADKNKIIEAIKNLKSGGDFSGEGGIKEAYALAEENFNKDGVNRIILATDGDFNIGIIDVDELKNYIQSKTENGIYLSVIGFGKGSYNEALMMSLAKIGNGNAAYIDNLNEARKILFDEATYHFFPIASEVKIHVEFNPKAVLEYRLIGHEHREFQREDLYTEHDDSGNVAARHSITAIYEITPVDSSSKIMDSIRYTGKKAKKQEKFSEYAFLKVNYKLPDENKSKLTSLAITKTFEKYSLSQASDNVRFATAVAGFGELLRGERYLSGFTFDDVVEIANGAKGQDFFGYRSEFVNLVRLAKALKSM